MKKLEKIITILLILIVTICYVNVSFATIVTEDNFYKELNRLHKGIRIEVNSQGGTSKISYGYDGYIIKKEENKIIYFFPEHGNIETFEAFSFEYKIEEDKFFGDIQINMDNLEKYSKLDSEENAFSYVSCVISGSMLETTTVIALANILGINAENVYAYYTENLNNEDSRGIITNENLPENDNHAVNKFIIDLEKFSKIDSTYLTNDADVKITYGEDIDNPDDGDTENKIDNENKVDNKNESDKNEIDNTNSNRNENTNTNTNTNENQNTNTNSNTNNSNNTNKNVTNTPNSNTKKIDNTISDKILPKTGIGRAGFVVILISIIGLYSYKKYSDYNKMF